MIDASSVGLKRCRALKVVEKIFNYLDVHEDLISGLSTEVLDTILRMNPHISVDTLARTTAFISLKLGNRVTPDIRGKITNFSGERNLTWIDVANSFYSNINSRVRR